MAVLGDTIETTAACPGCGLPLPVTVHLRTAVPVSTHQAVLVAEIERIDTLDFEAHMLGCAGVG